MADETNPVETTEEQTEEKQTVSAEQFEALQKQLEETRKAQSGSDRTVQELKELLKQREQEAEEQQKTAEQKMAERMAEIESKLQSAEKEKSYMAQKSQAVEMLSAEGLKAPKYIDRLIGDNEAETQELIAAYIEEKKADALNANADYAKKNGRKLESGKPDFKTIDDYSTAEIKAMTAEEFDKVMARSK